MATEQRERKTKKRKKWLESGIKAFLEEGQRVRKRGIEREKKQRRGRGSGEGMEET